VRSFADLIRTMDSVTSPWAIC